MCSVFLHYSQHALDEAYNQSIWAPDWESVLDRHARLSEEVRSVRPPLVERYGKDEDELLDIFVPEDARRSPIVVFIHGGAWRSQSKEDVSAPAVTFMNEGCIYIALEFSKITAKRLPDMVDQCRRGLLWVARNAMRIGGDPDRIFVGGHSSGGHLCGMMLTTNWARLGGDVSLIKGGLVLSGMYELHPVLLSARRLYVKLNAAEEAALSPIRHLSRVQSGVVVAWGDKESPEFKRQSRIFSEALAGMGRLVAVRELIHTDHFEVMDWLLGLNPVTEHFLALIRASEPSDGA